MNRLLAVLFIVLLIVILAEGVFLLSLKRQSPSLFSQSRRPTSKTISPFLTGSPKSLSPTVKLNLSPKPFDPFKKAYWELTEIINYPNGVKAAIVVVEKIASDESYFVARFYDGANKNIQISKSTEYYKRKIVGDGYSSTTKEESPFHLEKGGFYLLTWQKEEDSRIQALTITRKVSNE